MSSLGRRPKGDPSSFFATADAFSCLSVRLYISYVRNQPRLFFFHQQRQQILYGIV